MWNDVQLPGRDSPEGVRQPCALADIGERVAHLRDLAATLLAEIGLLEAGGPAPGGCGDPAGPHAACLSEQVRRLEVTLINRALAVSGRNKAEAARRLGIRPNTLHYKMRRYGLCADESVKAG